MNENVTLMRNRLLLANSHSLINLLFLVQTHGTCIFAFISTNNQHLVLKFLIGYVKFLFFSPNGTEHIIILSIKDS